MYLFKTGARMAIYAQTPLLWSWGHPPSQTPPSDNSNSIQSWLHLKFWNGAALPRVRAMPNRVLVYLYLVHRTNNTADIEPREVSEKSHLVFTVGKPLALSLAVISFPAPSQVSSKINVQRGPRFGLLKQWSCSKGVSYPWLKFSCHIECLEAN